MDLINVLLAWLFLKVCAFLIMIVGITYIIKTNEPPIIHQHNTTHQHTTIQVERIGKPTEEVCNRIDGCPIVDNVCVGCEVM